MKLKYDEQSQPKTLNQVCGQDKQSFDRFMKAKEAFLAKREENCVKQISGAWSKQLARVA